MLPRSYFWPDLHHLYLSLEMEGDSTASRLNHIQAELDRFPPAVREQLAADLAALSSVLSDLANRVLDSSGELSATN